ncbi:MAG: LamG-like jellyroll fold domain-containing protein [Thermoguttaceae bacterium]
MFKKRVTLWLGVLVLGGLCASRAAGGDGVGVRRVAADAFRVESGWQRDDAALRAQAAARAVSEIVLPAGSFAVWARFVGPLQLTAGEQSWKLRDGVSGRWRRVGSIVGGRLPLAVVASGEAEFHELLFSADAGYVPPDDETAVPRADGLLLALDFTDVARQSCRNTIADRTLHLNRCSRQDSGPWGHALRTGRHGVQVEDGLTFAAAAEAMTAMAWVRSESLGGYRAILFKGQRTSEPAKIHFHLGLADGQPEFKFADGKGAWAGLLRGKSYSVPAVPLGSWSHLAATFDKGTVRLYLNGRQVASRKSGVQRLIPNASALCIGEGQKSDGRPAFVFSGLIDGVKVFSRPLTSAEVSAVYEAGRSTHVNGGSPQDQPESIETPTFARKLKIVDRYEKNLPEDTIGHAKTTAAVRPHQGVPALWINDRPVAPIAMIPGGHFPRDVCRDFAAAGVHVYSQILWTWNGIVRESKAKTPEECTDWWLGPGKYAFERVDRQVQAMIAADPQAYIFLRLKLEPPAWWVRENPEELSQYEDGRRAPQYSMASEKWEATYERMLRDLIAHIEASSYAGHLIGYQPAGGQSSEWYWYGCHKGLIDYSPAACKRFGKWLKERYAGDVAALRKAWNDQQVDFDTARPPSNKARQATEHLLFRDSSKVGAVLDYQRFLTAMTVHHIIKSCRICKEASGGRKIAGVFYGYSFPYASTATGLWNLGFLGLQEVLDSPYVDFLCAPTNYSYRRGGEPGNFMSVYTDSYQLHQKLYWDEVDTRTCYYRDFSRCNVRTVPETLAVHQRALGYGLTKGTALWWFTLMGDHTFHDDAIMEDIARNQRASVASLAVDKSHVREIAVLVDEPSFLYMRMGLQPLMEPLTRDMHSQLATMGAPFDMYVLSDIADARMPDYKLYVFLNPFYLTDSQRAAIKAKVRRNGAVAVWFYAPGFIAEDGRLDVRGVRDLTGIAVRTADEERKLHLAVTNFDHPITAEIDRSDTLGQTEPVGPVFWVDDPQATVLGRLSPDGDVGMAVRDFGDWRSVYCASPIVNTKLLRGLARYAGAHVYSTTDDTFFANNNYAMIHTASTGPKEIRLPQPRDVYDALTGELLGRDMTSIRLEIPEQTTRIFRLVPPDRHDLGATVEDRR